MRRGCETFCSKPRSGQASHFAADAWGSHWRLHATIRRHGKAVDDLDCAIRRGRAEVCHLLGAVMKAEKHAESKGPSLLDVVALLADVPGEGLARGQVGKVVEELEDKFLLVEFSD